MNQPLKTFILEVDIAFSGYVPDILKENLDFETKGFLTNIKIWDLLITNWINYIKDDYSLTCPLLVRKSNLLSMGLILSDDLSLKDLNNNWRSKNVITDVISFPAFDENVPPPTNQVIELGDIVLSVETAIKQSQDHKHSLIYELQWLVSHGLLHLLGWEHPSSASLDKMLALQEKLIETTRDLNLKKISSDFR